MLMGNDGVITVLGNKAGGIQEKGNVEERPRLPIALDGCRCSFDSCRLSVRCGILTIAKTEQTRGNNTAMRPFLFESGGGANSVLVVRSVDV